MDSIKFYKLQKTLKENNIMFCYSGYVTQKILVAIGETIKKKLEVEETELGKTKKVFSIFVEGVQNVIRYSADSIGESDELDNDSKRPKSKKIEIDDSPKKSGFFVHKIEKKK